MMEQNLLWMIGKILRIAHPCDFLFAETWHLWQHECFVSERIQPFKQIFREVYVVTDAEKNETRESQRFYGHKIWPGQAWRLFHSRGWTDGDPYEIEICPEKTYPGITAQTTTKLVLYGYFRVTFGNVFFNDHKTPLEEVPAVIFSETMRDIDLVVSVAYAEEDEWEGTTSTIESRTALVRETCQLLNLGNVRIIENYAMIDGIFATYKVHLGSGSIHQVGGNYVCIVPDRAKKDGELFLPFVEKDEMASIILSKIILLAHDDRIKDPVILRQIKKDT